MRSEAASGRIGLGEREGPSVSPAASEGTNRAFCSSVPNVRIGSVAALVCTATVTPMPASARDSCSRTRMYDEVGAGAAMFLGDTDAHQPELAEPGEELPREVVLAIPLGRVRRDLRVGDVGPAPGSRCSALSEKSMARRVWALRKSRIRSFADPRRAKTLEGGRSCGRGAPSYGEGAQFSGRACDARLPSGYSA